MSELSLWHSPLLCPGKNPLNEALLTKATGTLFTAAGSILDFFKKQEGAMGGLRAGKGPGEGNPVDWRVGAGAEKGVGSPGRKWVDSSCILEGRGQKHESYWWVSGGPLTLGTIISKNFVVCGKNSQGRRLR